MKRRVQVELEHLKRRIQVKMEQTMQRLPIKIARYNGYLKIWYKKRTDDKK